MRRIGLIVTCVVACSALAAASGSATGSTSAAKRQFHHCGPKAPSEGAGWYRVRSRGIGCHGARRVARRHWRSGGEGVPGWNCSSEQIGDEARRARCHRTHNDHKQVVKFLYGA